MAKIAKTAKIQDNEGQFRVTIPLNIVKSKGWKQSKEIVFIQDISGNILIKEIKRGKKNL